ncbi:SipW-dependent-type signal peptide-containing protein [Gordonia sp. CPCC 206044]|uniref:SipW-dependent-type signal peptide-containing protein n=1 Tax=Gordonia sp. CPCC 206044 TaxID=3140793 RepID=UPI003AF33C28
MTTNNSQPVDRTTRNRKRKAILASGAVLGIGAIITLAAWNDSVWGNGAFGTGDNAWNVEGSTDGVHFAEYSEPGSPGAINFSIAELQGVDPSNLMPGKTAIGQFWLREGGQKMDANVTIEPPQTDAGNSLGNALNVKVFALGPDGMFGGDDDETVVNSTTLAAAGSGGKAFTIKAGEVRVLRFEVSLNTDSPNGLASTVTANWQMKAQSVDNT